MKLRCFFFDRLTLFLVRKLPEVNPNEHIRGRVYFVIGLLPLFPIPDESQPQRIMLLEQRGDDLFE